MNWFTGVTPQPNVSYYNTGGPGNSFYFGDAGTSVQVAYDQQPSQSFYSSPYYQTSSWASAPQTNFAFPSFSGSVGGDMFGGSSMFGGLNGFSSGVGLLGGLGGGFTSSLAGGGLFGGLGSSIGGSGLSTSSILDSIKGLGTKKDGSGSFGGLGAAPSTDNPLAINNKAASSSSGGLDIASILPAIIALFEGKKADTKEVAAADEEAEAPAEETPARTSTTTTALSGISEALNGLKDVVASLKDVKSGKKTTTANTATRATAAEDTEPTPPRRGAAANTTQAANTTTTRTNNTTNAADTTRTATNNTTPPPTRNTPAPGTNPE